RRIFVQLKNRRFGDARVADRATRASLCFATRERRSRGRSFLQRVEGPAFAEAERRLDEDGRPVQLLGGDGDADVPGDRAVREGLPGLVERLRNDATVVFRAGAESVALASDDRPAEIDDRGTRVVALVGGLHGEHDELTALGRRLVELVLLEHSVGRVERDVRDRDGPVADFDLGARFEGVVAGTRCCFAVFGLPGIDGWYLVVPAAAGGFAVDDLRA